MNQQAKQNGFTLFELLTVIAIIGILIALLLPAVQSARESARRLQCSNNMMQIGVAVKHYEKNHGVLPSGTVNDTGPIRNVPIGNHIGWIPRILPYIEQVPLYEQIDFSKGVYDPENRAVWFASLNGTFCCPSCGYNWGGRSRNVDYMVCHGGVETPIDVDNNGSFFLNSRIRSRDITDGTSNTVWLGESAMTTESFTYSPDSGVESGYYGGRKKYQVDPKDFGVDENDSVFAPSIELHYGGLGWMSGTPGTIRNTGSPINRYVGPFSNWPMLNPQEQESDFGMGFGMMSMGMGGGMMGPMMFDDDEFSFDEEDEDVLTAEDLNLDPEIWAEEVPAQYLVGGYGSYHVGGANFLMGDGSVRYVSETIDTKLYSNLGSRNDGQVIADDF